MTGCISSLTNGGQSNADRAKVLLSSEDYYREFRRAVLGARKSIFIAAWDINSQIELVKKPDDGSDDEFPKKLGELFDYVLKERDELSIYLCLWDYSMIYFNEREDVSNWNDAVENGDRFHLKLDDQLPLTASHHEKFVVVDEKLAFAGGMDLSLWRWDTLDHHYEDQRRQNPDGEIYPPLHDTMTMLEGPIVEDLVKHFRNRWERAGGSQLPFSSDRDTDATSLWPANISPDFEDVSAALYRTQAKFRGYDEIFECEALLLRSIKSAKELLFLENQYYSSAAINEAIIARLKEPDGPQVVMLLTEDTNGWLEEGTLGLARDYLFSLLRDADIHDRLRLLCTRRFSESGESRQVYIHSKLHCVDDEVLKIGSTNLTNRSMRIDTELDVAFVAENAHPAIERLRLELLSVHSAVPYADVKKIFETENSFVEGIDSLVEQSGGCLAFFPEKKNLEVKRMIAENVQLDPEEPMDPEYWMEKTAAQAPSREGGRKLVFSFVALIAILFIILGMSFIGGDTFSQSNVTQQLSHIADHRFTFPALIAIFAVLTLVGVPLNLLLVGAALAISPMQAFLGGVIGSLAAAVAGFSIGRRLGRPIYERHLASKMGRLSRSFKKGSVPAIAGMRLLPVAPFFVINMSCGALGVPFGKYALGTILGMVPGIFAVTMLSDRVRSMIIDPSWQNGLLFGLVVILVLGGAWLVQRAVERRST